MVVDDEDAYVEAYATWLRDRYQVETATSGTAALEQLDDEIDVMLLDRRMPTMSGDAVLEMIRERGYGCQIAMITAVDPDFDIVNLPFDDYLVKPVSRTELFDVVEALLTRAKYTSQVQECFSLVSKKAALESVMDRDQLASAAEYCKLLERIEMVETSIDETLTTLIDEGQVRLAYTDITP